MVRFDTYNASAHLVRQLEETGVADVEHDGADNILIRLRTGELVSIYLIETIIPPYEVRMTLVENANQGINTLFILWGDMFLPSHGQAFQPDEWLDVLFSLYEGKVYAFETVGKDIRIYPVFVEFFAGEYVVHHGDDVDVRELGCKVVYVSASQAPLPGFWHVANFAGDVAPPPREVPKPVVTAWEILGIPPSADRDSVKRAYWRLARLYHPDLNTADDATEQMQLLNQAYAAALAEISATE